MRRLFAFVVAGIVACTAALAVAMLQGRPAFAATNLIANPGFESPGSWRVTGTATTGTGNARSGARSMRVGTATGLAYQDITSGFTTGQVYVLFAYGKVGAQSESGFVGVQSLNAAGTVLYDAKVSFLNTSYTSNATTFVVPDGTRRLRAYVLKENGPRYASFYADDLSLYASTGTRYYVDGVHGSDSNAGTSSAKAWKTLANVNATAFGPGDSVLLRGGQTFTGGISFTTGDGGSRAYPITVTSYGAGRATIDSGTAADGIGATDTGGYHIYNLNLIGGGYATNTYAGIDFVNNSTTTRREVVTIDTVDVQGYYNGIYLYGANGKGYEPVTILSAVSHDNHREGISVWGYDSGGSSGGIWYAHGVSANVYIGYVAAYNNHTWSGILASNSDWAMIEHSTAHDIGDLCPAGPGPVGIWSTGSTNVTVQFNTSYRVHSSANAHDGDGFDISSNNVDAWYQYNYAYANDGPGYLVDEYIATTPPANTTVLRYNLAANDCQKILFCGELSLYGPVTNANIYQNTFYASSAVAATVRSAGSWDSTDPVRGPVNVTIRNNIVSSANGAQLVHVAQQDEDGLAWGDGGDLTFQGNLYYADPGTFAIYLKGTTYADLGTFRGSGQETNGGTATGVQGDPRLVAPGTNGDAANLKTGAGSPATNAGLNLPRLFGFSVGAIDYFGSAVPSCAYDIGAQEKWESDEDRDWSSQAFAPAVPAGGLPR